MSHDFPKVVKGEVPPVQHLRDGSHYVPDRLTAIRAELDALDLSRQGQPRHRRPDR